MLRTVLGKSEQPANSGCEHAQSHGQQAFRDEKGTGKRIGHREHWSGPGVQGTLHPLSPSSQNPDEMGALVVTIVQMSELRPRVVK